MKPQLGTHCPECGTTDVPFVMESQKGAGRSYVVTCPRCIHCGYGADLIPGLALQNAMVQFYGDAATREPSGIEIAAVLAAKLGRDYAKDPESPISTLDPDWWMKWATGQVRSDIKRRNKS